VIEQSLQAARFLDMHMRDQPLLMPNAWDAGSARMLESLGFTALGTTSSGVALALAQLDGSLDRTQTLELTARIVAASELPVSADLESGFADEPEGVAETVALARAAGLAGCSIEDSTGEELDPIHDLSIAVERVRAAVEAGNAGAGHMVLTARAENYLHGRPDLEDTILRLQTYASVGADVLYAPGVVRLEDIRRIVEEVEKPLNVLALANAPSVAELAAVGVKRISVGGAFAYAALGAVVEAASELKAEGTYSYWNRTSLGRAHAEEAFRPTGGELPEGRPPA
jgi:2-methylisocitrate lyase-like PEP mutase family enzyme